VLPGLVADPRRDPHCIVHPHEPPRRDVRTAVGTDRRDPAGRRVAEHPADELDVLAHRAPSSLPAAVATRSARSVSALTPSPSRTSGSRASLASAISFLASFGLTAPPPSPSPSP